MQTGIQPAQPHSVISAEMLYGKSPGDAYCSFAGTMLCWNEWSQAISAFLRTLYNYKCLSASSTSLYQKQCGPLTGHTSHSDLQKMAAILRYSSTAIATDSCNQLSLPSLLNRCGQPWYSICWGTGQRSQCMPFANRWSALPVVRWSTRKEHQCTRTRIPLYAYHQTLNAASPPQSSLSPAACFFPLLSDHGMYLKMFIMLLSLYI